MPEPGSSSGWNAPLTDRFDLSNHGLVVLKTGKVELGQGILLALRQIAAEELDLSVDAIVTVSGDTSASPFEGGTVGSMSIETSGHDVRDVQCRPIQAPTDELHGSGANQIGEIVFFGSIALAGSHDATTQRVKI